MAVSYLMSVNGNGVVAFNPNDEPMTVEQLQGFIGDYFEAIEVEIKSEQTTLKGALYFAENGRRNGLPVNHLATMLSGYEIVGNAVFTSF